jgi:hypothetical protein
MDTTKKPRVSSNAKRTKNEFANTTTVVAVPRMWLIALAVLVVLPWLIAGGIYVWNKRERASISPPRLSPADTSANTEDIGPWGLLTVTPIVISPPIEYIADDWGQSDQSGEWHFPATSAEMLEAFLATVGMSPEQIDRVRAGTRSDPRNRGFVITPDPELVRTMNPQVRARLYLQLAKSKLNPDQAHAFCFLGGSSETWFAGSLISQRTRQLIDPLIYRDGDYLMFADSKLIRSQVGDSEERQRLAKTMLRQATVLVRLTIRDASEVDELSEYWGRGGRRTDLRPLLESVVGSRPDRSIDIIHLLPGAARNHLYRYPKLSAADLNQPLLDNCLWTALNFFRTEPDDRFLDLQVALSTLKQDYYIVNNNFQLGDIIAFLDKNDVLFHVAVYIAGDLVFTKNGTSPVSPWVIMTIEQLKGFYHKQIENPRLIYHRRNDF